MRIVKIETPSGDFIELPVNEQNKIDDRNLELAVRLWFSGWLSPVAVTVSTRQ
jgi:hypothetical protein